MIRLIGDVHGKLQEYRRLTEKVDYSIAMGEMGFDLRPLVQMYLDGLDGSRHIVLPGNHDNYDVIPSLKTFLTDPGYGLLSGFGPLQNCSAFYVRGAQSIPHDKAMRTQGVSWWPEEELVYSVLDRAIQHYIDVRPDIMFTHTAPDDIVVNHLLKPGQVKYNFLTETALQEMLDAHAPQLWVFGHFHLTKKFVVGKTTFVALGELATCDLDPNTLSCCVRGKSGFDWGEGGY